MDTDADYDRACRLAERGDYRTARDGFTALQSGPLSPSLEALLANDLAVLDGLAGRYDEARAGFRQALAVDAGCRPAADNLALLDETEQQGDCPAVPDQASAGARRTKVALVSLLFNWPSTGGGTVHTAETARFLQKAGYDVRHFCARYAGWGVGGLESPPPVRPVVLDFDDRSWNAPSIQQRFREAVGAFAPDWVIVTDSWNFKPLLAEAVADHPYFLRLAAQECLCPLNNVRLLVGADGTAGRCPRHQLAASEACRACVGSHQNRSGGLHRADRALSGFGSDDYDARLRAAFAGAAGVLVVNPLIEAAIAPWCRSVRVVPSGFDPARFAWDTEATPHDPSGPVRLIFAGLVEEFMKGFPVLQAACRRLWRRRQDFELVVTGDAPAQPDPFARYIGWQSQAALPQALRDADLLVFPTVAEEALGRTAVEAMAAGRPVVASRIGGLQFTVVDGATGLLFEPGNPADLAAKLERMLDDPELRRQYGRNGRRRFEEHYTWDQIIARHYRPLLGEPVRC